MLAVRWYLRFGLSYRDLEELARRARRRGRSRDAVPVGAALHAADRRRSSPRRHAVGDRWFVDETYVKVNGSWRYVYRAGDQHGQVIDVLVSSRRDSAAATRFFARVLEAHGTPGEITTDKAHALATAIEAGVPEARHNTEQYANNRVESDHARLKARLRPMRGLKRDRNAQVIITGQPDVHLGGGSGPRRSSRTSDGATTNSAPTPEPTYASPPASTK